MLFRFLVLLLLFLLYIFCTISLAAYRHRPVRRKAPLEASVRTAPFTSILTKLATVREIVSVAHADARFVDADDPSRALIRTSEIAFVDNLIGFARFSASLIEAIDRDEISCVPVAPSYRRHTSKVVLPNTNPFEPRDDDVSMLGTSVITQPPIIYNNNVLLELLQRYMHLFEATVSKLSLSMSTRGARAQSQVESMLSAVADKLRDLQPRLFTSCADQKVRLAGMEAVHPSLYSYEFRSESITQPGASKMHTLRYGRAGTRIGLSLLNDDEESGGGGRVPLSIDISAPATDGLFGAFA